MPKFTTRHYVEIGTVLREIDAPDDIVDAFVALFRRDNDNFDEKIFRRFVSIAPTKVRVK